MEHMEYECHPACHWIGDVKCRSPRIRPLIRARAVADAKATKATKAVAFAEDRTVATAAISCSDPRRPRRRFRMIAARVKSPLGDEGARSGE